MERSRILGGPWWTSSHATSPSKYTQFVVALLVLGGPLDVFTPHSHLRTANLAWQTPWCLTISAFISAGKKMATWKRSKSKALPIRPRLQISECLPIFFRFVSLQSLDPPFWTPSNVSRWAARSPSRPSRTRASKISSGVSWRRWRNLGLCPNS